jgi:hypothetical protein
VAIQLTSRCFAAAIKPPFCSGSYRLFQSHLRQARIRSILH